MGKINFFFMQQHLRLQELLIITLQKTTYRIGAKMMCILEMYVRMQRT